MKFIFKLFLLVALSASVQAQVGVPGGNPVPVCFETCMECMIHNVDTPENMCPCFENCAQVDTTTCSPEDMDFVNMYVQGVCMGPGDHPEDMGPEIPQCIAACGDNCETTTSSDEEICECMHSCDQSTCNTEDQELIADTFDMMCPMPEEGQAVGVPVGVPQPEPPVGVPVGVPQPEPPVDGPKEGPAVGGPVGGPEPEPPVDGPKEGPVGGPVGGPEDGPRKKVRCNPGQYLMNKRTNDEHCEICPAGSFTAKVNRNKRCKRCGSKSYSPVEGMDSCIPCPKGYFTKGRKGKKQCFNKKTGMSMRKEARMHEKGMK